MYSSFTNRRIFLIKHQQICFIANRLLLRQEFNKQVRMTWCTLAHPTATAWPLSIYCQSKVLFTQAQFDLDGNIFTPQL